MPKELRLKFGERSAPLYGPCRIRHSSICSGLVELLDFPYQPAQQLPVEQPLHGACNFGWSTQMESDKVPERGPARKLDNLTYSPAEDATVSIE